MRRMKLTVILGLLLVGTVLFSIACSQSTTNSSYEDDNGGDKDDQNKIGSVTQDLQSQSYIFARHRFMNADETMTSSESKETKIAWSNARYNEANDYMKTQIADLKNKIDTDANAEFLSTIFYDNFKNAGGYYTDGFDSDIDDSLTFANPGLHEMLGAISGKFATATIKNGTYTNYEYNSDVYGNFNAHYDVLALRAYKDSLGFLREDDHLPFNQEQSTINNTLEQQATKLGNNIYSASSAQDTNAVEDKLYSMLELVARETGVRMDTLQAVVNVSLLNNSLWGARDLGARAGIQLNNENQLIRSTGSNLTHSEYNAVMTSAATYQMYLDQTAQAQQDQGYSR